MKNEISFNNGFESDRMAEIIYLLDMELCLADIARIMRTNLRSIKHSVDTIIKGEVLHQNDFELLEKKYNQRVPRLAAVYYFRKIDACETIMHYEIFAYINSLHDRKLKEYRDNHLSQLSNKLEKIQRTVFRLDNMAVSTDSIFSVDEIIFELWLCSFKPNEIRLYLKHLKVKTDYVNFKIAEIEHHYKDYFYRAFTKDEIKDMFSELPNINFLAHVSGIPTNIIKNAISNNKLVSKSECQDDIAYTQVPNSALTVEKHNPYIHKNIEMGRKLDAIRNEGIIREGKKIYPNINELEEYSREHKELRLPRCRTSISKDLKLYYATIEDEILRKEKIESIKRHKPGMQNIGE